MDARQLSKEQYTVGWIAALPLELAAAAAMLDEKHKKPLDFVQPPSDKNAYTWGSIGEHHVVIASLAAGVCGIVSAATTALPMLSSFPNIRVGLMVGIGAGIARPTEGRDIRLGDIVVSQPDGQGGGVIQYDLGKERGQHQFERRGVLNMPPEALLKALAKLQAQHEMQQSQVPIFIAEMIRRYPQMARSRAGRPGFVYQGRDNDRLFKAAFGHAGGSSCTNCDLNELVSRDERDSEEPEIHYGIIASGNKLVKDAFTRDLIAEGTGEECICLEMEAAGLMNSFPCLVIRGICDYADSHKNDRWQRYAAATAAAYAKEFLGAVPGADLEETKKAAEVLEAISKTLTETRSGVDNLERYTRHSQHQHILDWLTPTDYALQQSDFISRRKSGTGQWLLESNEFNDWLNGDQRTLFCPGMPGAGKTIFSSIVVEYLHRKFRQEPNIGVAYVYFNFRREQEQRPEDLLASLLKQLIQERDAMPQAVTDLYSLHHKRRTRPSFDELSEALHKAVTECSRTFIVVDALDECQFSNDERTKLLAAIFDLQNGMEVKILATSRHISEIEKEFGGRSISLEIKASEGDVHSYLDSRMSALPSFVQEDPGLQEEIRTKIVAAVDGMFLLAQLQLESLIGKWSRKSLKLALRKLSSGSEAYDQAYDEAMKRIQSQHPDRKDLAIQVLSWIVCAKRPLTGLEIRHALAVESDEKMLDEDNLPEIQTILSVCLGLVTEDKESSIIRLVHYTTQEFLERRRLSYIPDCFTTIGSTCVTYLSFDAFEAGFCEYDELFETRLECHPLYDFAARYWGYYVLESSLELEPATLALISRKEKISAAAQALMVVSKHSGGYDSQQVPRNVTSGHLAVYFGLCSALQWLLNNGLELEVRNSWRQGLLDYASQQGYDRIVQILLDGGADVNAQGGEYGSALQAASLRGYEKIVQMLLDKGADINAQGRKYGSVLQAASLRGYEKIVQMLLDRGADVNAQGGYYSNALQAAAALQGGNEKIVQTLLDRGADVNAQGGYYSNALQAASLRGYEKIVQMLLGRGADVNAQGGYYGNALQAASHNGHDIIVKMLLDSNAKVNISAGFFMISAWQRQTFPMSLFLQHILTDVVTQKDKNGSKTLLHWAAEHGVESIVTCCLERGADCNARDRYEETPLHYAAEMGHLGVVRLLVEKGAETEATDMHARTPLGCALGQGVSQGFRDFRPVRTQHIHVVTYLRSLGG